jgi:hypothetical protein
MTDVVEAVLAFITTIGAVRALAAVRLREAIGSLRAIQDGVAFGLREVNR